MRNETRARGLWAWMSVLALALLVAGPALARGADGAGILEAKDEEAMTLQLDELIVHVTDDTRIYDGADKRISFAQIPDPRRAQSTVEYTGRYQGREVVATKLVVYLTPQ